MYFNEEDKPVYHPPNDLILKSEAVQAIAEYEMYGAQMDNPGTASDDIEDWKELGEIILHDVHPVEPMPNYIDNVLIARHYCNGMVAMNEECYQRLQKVKEPRRGHWIDVWDRDDPDTSSKGMCTLCGKIQDRPLGHFCKWCGADMRDEKEEEHEEASSTKQQIRAQKAREGEQTRPWKSDNARGTDCEETPSVRKEKGRA